MKRFFAAIAVCFFLMISTSAKADNLTAKVVMAKRAFASRLMAARGVTATLDTSYTDVTSVYGRSLLNPMNREMGETEPILGYVIFGNIFSAGDSAKMSLELQRHYLFGEGKVLIFDNQEKFGDMTMSISTNNPRAKCSLDGAGTGCCNDCIDIPTPGLHRITMIVPIAGHPTLFYSFSQSVVVNPFDFYLYDGNSDGTLDFVLSPMFGTDLSDVGTVSVRIGNTFNSGLLQKDEDGDYHLVVTYNMSELTPMMDCGVETVVTVKGRDYSSVTWFYSDWFTSSVVQN